MSSSPQGLCSIFGSSLEEENAESVCGANLTLVNQKLSKALPLFAGAFASMNDYISVIISGQSWACMSPVWCCVTYRSSEIVTYRTNINVGVCPIGHN